MKNSSIHNSILTTVQQKFNTKIRTVNVFPLINFSQTNGKIYRHDLSFQGKHQLKKSCLFLNIVY